MKQISGAVILLVLTAGHAAAGHMGGPGFGDFRFGGHGGPFDLFAGLGGALPFAPYNTEWQQARFENRFENIQTQYDEGVAEIADFYVSDEYDGIVDHTERLVDRYGLFLSGVERGVDRLTDIIDIANDDLTYFNDLLADYQADEELSAARLARIERWISGVTDRLSSRIDFLTDKQSSLQENLSTYQTFQGSMSTFLQDIVTAAGGTTGGSSSSLLSLAAMSSSLLSTSTSSLNAMVICAPEVSGSGSAVPEPKSLTLVLTCVCLLIVRLRMRPIRVSSR